MASASSLPCEEQLLCSICLNMFTEPVSTPCGHNYCKTCITGYWSNRDLIQCPLCKKKFRKNTQLQVNTGFRDMVEHFNNMRVRGEDETPAKPGEVTCDICLELKLRAQKTCLVCLASYCQLHLEPHQRVKTLKKHQLIEPVSNLEDRVCKKHDRMFEFFCHEDQMYICVMCLKEEHVTHEAVPLEQEFREKKALLGSVMSQVKIMENTKSGNIKEIKHFVKQSRKQSDKEMADITEVFTAPVVSLQSSQAELIQVIQEKQKAAEKEAEDRATPLEQEVAELREKRLEMEKLLQTEDHFRFLQSCPVLPFPEHSVIGKALSQSSKPIDLSDISQQSYVRIVKKAVDQTEKILSYELMMLVNKVRSSDNCEADEQSKTEEEWTQPLDKLMMIQQNESVNVTLDSYTAHSTLAVSEDGKQLRFFEGVPSLSFFFWKRFRNQPFVLGRQGFSFGRFYYEVRVSDSKGWVLGVAKESVNKKINSICPEVGVWAVDMYINHEGEACFTDISGHRYVRQKPQTVGVFVDYEKGEVSFYDVGARTLIHSYTGCTFIEMTESLFYGPGLYFQSRPKLHPFFGFLTAVYDPDNMLEITPVAGTSFT
ncbi:E3 ubiquitin-protein ligase TRIM39-like [Centropristis striata]|uniref:E3 ubiquitin-protein ligase TRIM39-like n=1 Tax=Centropristis striata TaxID=184440 RepID=UPI0027E0817D|nr:E3 ubiquitin-protein ligase TRIM39-like [Centropristis striata]